MAPNVQYHIISLKFQIIVFKYFRVENDLSQANYVARRIYFN